MQTVFFFFQGQYSWISFVNFSWCHGFFGEQFYFSFFGCKHDNFIALCCITLKGMQCWALWQGHMLLCRRGFFFFFFHWNDSLSSVSLRHCCRAMGHCHCSAVCLVVSMLPTSDSAIILNNHKLCCGFGNMAKCSWCAEGGLNANLYSAARHALVM